jgi:hypothetical protein
MAILVWVIAFESVRLKNGIIQKNMTEIFSDSIILEIGFLQERS